MAWSKAGLTLVFIVGAYLVALGARASISGTARAARYEKMRAICAAHGAGPGAMRVSPDFVHTQSGDRRGFEYEFSVAGDFWFREEKEVSYFTILTSSISALRVPWVSVRRKNAPSEAAELVGPHTVGVESIDFSDRFEVRSRDERAAFMLLDLPLLQWTLDCAEVSFELVGDQLLAYVYRPDEPASRPALAAVVAPRHTDAPELELLFRFVEGFGSRVPELLMSEYGAGVQPTTPVS